MLRATVAYDGEVAAYGMAAVVGTDAMFHDVQTEAAHRRHGSGGR
ncbi:hypothetical protein OG394_16830 [Kribbella sp. NBC_01245]|nr:hypothetical protein [Kribbella sp. NBC_01245]